MRKFSLLVFIMILAALSALTQTRSSSIYERLLERKSGRDSLKLLALWEDGRVTGKGRLFSYLKSSDPLIRLRAVEVIGRIQNSSNEHYLVKMLKDPDGRVVEEAIFALGQFGDSSVVGALLQLRKKGSVRRTMRIAEALGKIGGSEAVDALKIMLQDFQSGIRRSAALALARTSDPAAVSSLLIAIHDQDPRVVYKVIYALEKIKSDRVINAVLPFLKHRDSTVRAFAARALGKQKAGSAVNDLRALLKDDDLRVVVNAARALGELRDGKAAKSLGKLATEHASFHARREAAAALGKIKSRSAEEFLIKALSDESPGVRTQAISSLAVILKKDAQMYLLMSLEDGDRAVRAAAMEGFGAAGIGKKRPFLMDIARSNKDPLMQAAAVRGLAVFNDTGMGGFFANIASSADWVVAVEAVEAIGTIESKQSIPQLIEIYRKRSSRNEGNIRLAVLNVLKKFQAVQAEKLALNALEDSDKRIRVRAAELLSEIGVKDITLKPDAYYYERDFNPSRKLDLELPLGKKYAVIHTARGDIELELFGDDAIQTVANFIKLSGSFYKAGHNFHRVVPNFVIQGGCPRGDGWGDAGYYIRSEFNRHTYERGYVGIAHDGKDTGGSQFFITLSSQRHLDGRYTIFGRVTKGMDVVDKIDQGDTFTVSADRR